MMTPRMTPRMIPRMTPKDDSISKTDPYLGSMPQISLAYSAMVLSEENLPELGRGTVDCPLYTMYCKLWTLIYSAS